jgi:pyruvate-ferredoxin/flavodoxin oxidoreductase
LALLAEGRASGLPHAGLEARLIGGRYGLASKEFTPGMAAAVFENLASSRPKRGFTVGIVDDVSHTSLTVPADFVVRYPGALQAMFYGLGSDGTVGANKNTVKILADNTPLHAQGYFVYDSKKSGAMTVSHVRISPSPIRATYLIEQADFVGCHQFSFVDRIDILERAVDGATLLLNAPFGPEEVWDRLPDSIQRTIIDRKIRLHVIDAESIARGAGMAGRINVIMQACFFALTHVLPIDKALSEIRSAIEATYGKRGSSVVEKNFAAVDAALAGLHAISVPSVASVRSPIPIQSSQDSFIDRVTQIILAGRGDMLPVSAMPIDGTFPTGTASIEKRSIATEIPRWESELCIQCGLCSFVCPHAAIRVKAVPEHELAGAPHTLVTKPWTGKDLPNHRMWIQVAPDDCTGCGVCVDVCPARSKEAVKVKAINMANKREHLATERIHFDYFLTLPEVDRTQVEPATVKGSQHLLPLFEFSGACAGCGETPYLKLVSQLFGDRMVVANATGCSSIYGGNLPTTPWSKDASGRGPAWANSLFEDNAEFGLGMRLALDQRERVARVLLRELAGQLPANLVDAIVNAPQETEQELADQRARIERLRQALTSVQASSARRLESLADALVKKSVWIIGGDGWAYDIGFGGLDHVMASGKNVNMLVLDTEVYSNTGGQASKATPRAAVAKFATGGKGISKKDIGMIAMAYGHVYVAQIALGAHPLQTLRAITEAESYHGPSLLLAYSQCIAHGVDLSTGMTHQKEAVNSGYWPLYRFDPRVGHDGGKPFHLDSRKPSLSFKQFAAKEARFSMLMRSDPTRAEQLMQLAQMDIDDRWHYYEQIANVERSMAGLMDEVIT